MFKAELINVAIGSAEAEKNEILQGKIAILLKVENVDESYKRLQSKGLNFLAEQKDMAVWGIRFACLRDPENNLIELFSDLPNQEGVQ